MDKVFEFIETLKDNPKNQKDVEFIVNKFSNESSETQSQIRQNALIQRNYKEAVERMGETIEDMDKEIELKDNKINFLADETGTSNEQEKEQNPAESLRKHTVINRKKSS